MVRPVTRRAVLHGAMPLVLPLLTEKLDAADDTRPSECFYFPDPRVAELVLAAASGQAGHVRELVAAGVDPNARGKHGLTPLLWATEFGNTAGMAALMRAGADPTRGDDRTSTPLSVAIDGPPDTKRLEALIKGGAPVNFVDHDESLLMRATTFGHIEQVRLLIQAGADVNWQNPAGRTALITGALSGNMKCALLLLGAGADPLHRDLGDASFVDYLALDDLDIMAEWAREDRARVLAWLRAHNVPLVTRRGEVIER